MRDKDKSYRRLGNLLRLWSFCSGDSGLRRRDGVGRFGLLHGGNRGSNSFRGRHYNNTGKLELERYGINRDGRKERKYEQRRYYRCEREREVEGWPVKKKGVERERRGSEIG